MLYVDNQGIQIHYKIDGGGPALILHHGSASSLQDWYQNGYVEPLKAHYQLIMIDARGHGNSDKPHDTSAYALSYRVSDVVAVLDKLGINKAHYWGYSMGGWIGFGMAKYAPERVHTLILGGAHPYADSADAFRDVDGTEPDAFIEAMEKFVDLRITGIDRKQVLENDLQALSAAMQDRESLEHILPTMTMPCFLFVGGNDPRAGKVRACANLLQNAQSLIIPDLDHSQTNVRSDLVLPHVMAFIQNNQTL